MDLYSHMDVLTNVTPLVIAIIFIFIVMSRRREKRKSSAPQVYASQALQQEREALLDRLSFSAWNRYNINEVEQLIGLIKAKKRI